MPWWKRKVTDRCQLCRAKLPTGSVVSRSERVHVDVGETTYVSLVCADCWQRHLTLAAEFEAAYRREHPLQDVCTALLEGDSVTRAEAADTLWRLGDRHAIPALREALTREGWHQTLTQDGWRCTASPAIVETLAELGGPEAEHAVAAELRNHTAWDIWYNDIHDEPDVPPAEEYIAPALVQAGGPGLLVGALLDLLTDKDLATSLREHAVGMLEHIASTWGTRFGVTPWNHEQLTAADRDAMLEPLRAALTDKSKTIRSEAATALRHLGDGSSG